MQRGTLLMLNEIPENTPNLPVLRDLAASQERIWTETTAPCASVHLAHQWEEYLGYVEAALSHEDPGSTPGIGEPAGGAFRLLRES